MISIIIQNDFWTGFWMGWVSGILFFGLVLSVIYLFDW